MKRKCDSCGEEKDVKDGKVCSNGHFICRGCLWKNAGPLGGPLKNCPLDKKPLR